MLAAFAGAALTCSARFRAAPAGQRVFCWHRQDRQRWPAGRTEAVNFREVSFANKTRDILFQSSFFPRDGDSRWSSGAAVFFAWVKDPAPRVRVDDPRIQVQDYALFRAIDPA